MVYSMTTWLARSAARGAGTAGRGRRLREASAISMREAADILGVSPSTLSRWERGVVRPRGAAADRYGLLLAEWSELGKDGT